MPTDKKRVQGYLSDTAYQYLENYRVENSLKSQSLALEKLLESLAIKGSSGDLESESYSKLKSELKSDLMGELSDLINLRLGVGNNISVPTHDFLPDDLSSDSQDNEVLSVVPDLESQGQQTTDADLDGQGQQTDQRVSADFLKTLEGHFCLAEVCNGIPEFWNASSRDKTGHFPSLYASERSAKTSLTKIKKQGVTGLEVYGLGTLFGRLDPECQAYLVPFLQKAIEKKD